MSEVNKPPEPEPPEPPKVTWKIRGSQTPHVYLRVDRFLPKTRSKLTFWLFLLIFTLHSGLPDT